MPASVTSHAYEKHMLFDGEVVTTMPSRRDVLHAASLASACVVGGCAALRPPSTDVDVTLLNFVDEERTVSVVVRQDDEAVFRTENTIAASEPEAPAESVEIPGAFEGTDGEQFTVDVTPDGQPTDTYDYEITCADFDTEDSFSAWVLDPEVSEDGKRTHFTVAYCAGK